MAFSPIFPISAVALFATFALWKLFTYARKDTPVHCFLTAYGAFVLTFSSAVLLPYDIVVTIDRGSFDPQIRLLWKVLYWSLWTFNWFFLPVFIEQQRTGSWRTSFRNNGIWWLGYLVIGIITLCYYLGTVGFTSISEIYWFFYAMSYAFSNAYGLVLISVLLGYAFVALPQHLADISNPATYLNVLYARVVSADEARLNTKFDLEDRFNAYRQEGHTAENRKAAEIVASAAKFLNKSLTESSGHLRARRSNSEDGLVAQLTDSSIGRLADALGNAERRIFKYEELVQECIESENYLANDITPMNRKYEDIKLVIYKIASYATGGLSLVTIIAQATIFIPLWWLSVLAIMYRLLVVTHSEHATSEFWTICLQILVALPLTYSYLASFWAAFRFKLSNSYGLYPNHNTDAYSLMWCSSILSRTAFSTCYNYIFVLRMQNDQVDTGFMNTMKKLSMVPLFGDTFVMLLPFLIVLLAVMQYTRTYHKIIHWLGLTMLQMESAVYAGSGEPIVKEGKAIVARERQKRSMSTHDAIGRNERTAPLIKSSFEMGILQKNDIL